MQVLWLAVRKEFRVWLRDPKVFAASVFAPLVLLLAFSLMFGQGKAFPIAVTDLDRSPASRQLVELIGARESELGGRYFEVVGATPAEGERRWQGRSVMAWLTIPEGFGENLRARRASDLPLALDNSNSDLAKNIRLYLNEAVNELYSEAFPEAQVTIVERREAGRKVSWIESIGMGLTGLAIALAGLFNGFNSLLSEFRSHTVKGLLLSPRPLRYILAAKVVYAALGGLLSGSLMLGVLWLATGLPLTHGLGGFLLLAVLAALTYVLVGMIIGLLVRQYMPAAAVSMLVGVISWFLSGSLGSLKVYSRSIQAVAAFLPISYAQEGLRGLLLYGDSRALWVNAAYLAAALAIALGALAAVVRKRFSLTWS